MEEQALVPGVQQEGEAAGGRPQRTAMGQGHAQGMGRGVKEETVHLPGCGGEEEQAQLSRQGEGDHE